MTKLVQQPSTSATDQPVPEVSSRCDDQCQQSPQASSTPAKPGPVQCSKCQKECVNTLVLYAHVLNCSNDYIWMQAKKRMKNRRANRKRKRTNRTSQAARKAQAIAAQNAVEKSETASNHSGAELDAVSTSGSSSVSSDAKKKSRSPPRPRDSDSDIVKRITANLPPKRVSRQIIQTTKQIRKRPQMNIVKGKKQLSEQEYLEAQRKEQQVAEAASLSSKPDSTTFQSTSTAHPSASSPPKDLEKDTAMKALSQEEKLFYECCSMLKESNADNENLNLTVSLKSDEMTPGLVSDEIPPPKVSVTYPNPFASLPQDKANDNCFNMGDSFPSFQDVSESENYIQTINQRYADKHLSDPFAKLTAAEIAQRTENDGNLSPQNSTKSTSSQASVFSQKTIKTKGALKGYDNFKVSIPMTGLHLAKESKLDTLADVALCGDIPKEFELKDSGEENEGTLPDNASQATQPEQPTSKEDSSRNGLQSTRQNKKDGKATGKKLSKVNNTEEKEVGKPEQKAGDDPSSNSSETSQSSAKSKLAAEKKAAVTDETIRQVMESVIMEVSMNKNNRVREVKKRGKGRPSKASKEASKEEENTPEIIDGGSKPDSVEEITPEEHVLESSVEISSKTITTKFKQKLNSAQANKQKQPAQKLEKQEEDTKKTVNNNNQKAKDTPKAKEQRKDTPEVNKSTTNNAKLKQRKGPPKKMKNVAYDPDSDFEDNIKCKKVKKKLLESDIEANLKIEQLNAALSDSILMPAPRRKRNAAETLYFWSSSSEEDDMEEDFVEVTNKKGKKKKGAAKQKPAVGQSKAQQKQQQQQQNQQQQQQQQQEQPQKQAAAGATTATTTEAGDDTSSSSEHMQQHGWIVGDSHKKLVTLLAHAKGKQENRTVKATGNRRKT
ncbi:hypothetical protein quinque_007917 [Culex quinquefasciatus]